MRQGVYLILITLLTHHSTMSQVQSSSYNTLLKTLLSHSVSEISVDEAREKLGSVVFLDSRSKEEFDVSHIEGALHVGYDNFELTSVEGLDKKREVVVYCSVGYRSEKITEKLHEAGFKNVHNLYGGIFEWKNQGNEVMTPEGKPTEDVHAYNRLWGIWLKKGNRVYD
ncbi:MAG: rhodanese-like domain-containing protein [Flavobacteriales bacterium]|nr:rhodanese-like domain-containing protein [Flavobacteriales bacterium]